MIQIGGEVSNVQKGHIAQFQEADILLRWSLLQPIEQSIEKTNIVDFQYGGESGHARETIAF